MNDTSAQQLAVQLGHIQAADIQMNAMKAANQERKEKGLAQAYGEQAFMDLLDEYDLTYNSIVEKGRMFF